MPYNGYLAIKFVAWSLRFPRHKIIQLNWKLNLAIKKQLVVALACSLRSRRSTSQSVVTSFLLHASKNKLNEKIFTTRLLKIELPIKTGSKDSYLSYFVLRTQRQVPALFYLFPFSY